MCIGVFCLGRGGAGAIGWGVLWVVAEARGGEVCVCVVCRSCFSLV